MYGNLLHNLRLLSCVLLILFASTKSSIVMDMHLCKHLLYDISCFELTITVELIVTFWVTSYLLVFFSNILRLCARLRTSTNLIVHIIHIVLNVNAYVEVVEYIQFLCFLCHGLFIIMLFFAPGSTLLYIHIHEDLISKGLGGCFWLHNHYYPIIPTYMLKL